MNIRLMKQPHYVYLLQGVGNDYFKIGMSRNVTRRKRQYSVPFDMVIAKWFQAKDYWAALDLEKRIQKLYRNRRCRGEWFQGLKPEFFVSDLEWLAMGEYERAEKEYLKRGESFKEKPEDLPEVIPSKETSYRDKIVLEILRNEGLAAAKALRKELGENDD